MIKSFADKDTEGLWNGERPRCFHPDIVRPAWRKLLILHAATKLDDLASLPGHRLEKLTGDREGQYSIRINRQWRVCFVWRTSDAWSVEVCDYH